MRPDAFFTAAQQERLAELMQRWRRARDTNTVLPKEAQDELHSLVAAELEGATRRAESRYKIHQ